MASVVTVFADGGYAGKLVTYARQVLRLAVELVTKPDDQRGFAVLPRRWVVERTFAWLVRCRRLDHDYERQPATSETWIKWAMIGIMVRRLEPGPGRRPWQPLRELLGINHRPLLSQPPPELIDRHVRDTPPLPGSHRGRKAGSLPNGRAGGADAGRPERLTRR